MIAATKVQQLDPPHTMRESNRQRADAYHELLLLLQPVLCCVAPPLTRSWQFAPLLASAALLHAAQLTRLQHKTTGCRSACCADMIHAQLKTHYHSTGRHTHRVAASGSAVLQHNMPTDICQQSDAKPGQAILAGAHA